MSSRIPFPGVPVHSHAVPHFPLKSSLDMSFKVKPTVLPVPPGLCRPLGSHTPLSAVPPCSSPGLWAVPALLGSARWPHPCGQHWWEVEGCDHPSLPGPTSMGPLATAKLMASACKHFSKSVYIHVDPANSKHAVREDSGSPSSVSAGPTSPARSWA